MDRLTDFSINRILSTQLGRTGTEAPGLLQPGLAGPMTGPGPRLVPVSVPSCLYYTGRNFGEQLYAYGAGFQCADFTGIYPVMKSSSTEAPPPPSPALTTLWFQTTGSALSAAVRPKIRVRTQFTDTQTKQLEALMEKDQYPTTDTRSEMARNMGLSDETVRVWFKNRRARRKRQRVDPLPNKPPSSTCGADPERKLITSFL